MSATSSTGFHWSVMAGVFAACASISAKFAMSTFIHDVCFEFMSSSVTDVSPEHSTPSKLNYEHICYYPSMLFRVSCFAFVFICNGLMWTFFTKSLQLTNSLTATIINSSVNLFLTALVGWLLFEEVLNTMWVLGSAFIVVGLVIIQKHSFEQTALSQKKHL
ncbi:hypothetical protein HELRODRAFT_185801 [Helobdella robusta]|uniref:Uncharacterized protein n=1 Tax=Helobdella robusta TaxID=6412 RepID=T1FNB0_HELRO|nr:hypothetical protein HELRODRAFT_185801 [Helobdella robusta]ESN99695.1 hypothetical protein HELRODRAFT_185801 [Helobdella robusta]